MSDKTPYFKNRYKSKCCTCKKTIPPGEGIVFKNPDSLKNGVRYLAGCSTCFAGEVAYLSSPAEEAKAGLLSYVGNVSLHQPRTFSQPKPLEEYPWGIIYEAQFTWMGDGLHKTDILIALEYLSASTGRRLQVSKLDMGAKSLRCLEIVFTTGVV